LCGSDGCLEICGNGIEVTGGCPPLKQCQPETFTCGNLTYPDCEDLECGPGLAGGACGTCPCPECDPLLAKCEAGICIESPGLGCGEILACLNACPPGDQTCVNDCFDSATDEGSATYNSMINCLDAAGYFDCKDEFPIDIPAQEECLNETFKDCKDIYLECISGDGLCVDLYFCLIYCPGGDAGDACKSACFGAASVEANTLWDAFIDCLDLNGYFDCTTGDSACYDAAWETCDPEFKECAYGELTCGQILGCRQACEWWDSTCNQKCLQHGSVEAQAALAAMGECVEQECPVVTGQCEQEVLLLACFDTYVDCVAPPEPEPDP